MAASKQEVVVTVSQELLETVERLSQLGLVKERDQLQDVVRRLEHRARDQANTDDGWKLQNAIMTAALTVGIPTTQTCVGMVAGLESRIKELRASKDKLQAERDQARAARDTWASLKDMADTARDNAQAECRCARMTEKEILKDLGKLQDAIGNAARDTGARTVGLTYVQIVRDLVDRIKGLRKSLDNVTQERDEAQAELRGSCGMLEHEARTGAGSWEASFSRLKGVIHECANQLGLPKGGTCRDIVKRIAQLGGKVRRLEEQLGEEQQDRVSMVGELQQVKGELQHAERRGNNEQALTGILEVALRKALHRLHEDSKEAILPKVIGAIDSLREALELTGLDSCEPIQSPCDGCTGKQCGSCGLGIRKMARGAVRQARDLLAQVERGWEPQENGWQLQSLGEALTRQRARCREAKIMLNTVLADD